MRVHPMNQKFEVTLVLNDQPHTYTKLADGPNHAVERALRSLGRDVADGTASVQLGENDLKVLGVVEVECTDTDPNWKPSGDTVVLLHGQEVS